MIQITGPGTASVLKLGNGTGCGNEYLCNTTISGCARACLKDVQCLSFTYGWGWPPAGRCVFPVCCASSDVLSLPIYLFLFLFYSGHMTTASLRAATFGARRPRLLSQSARRIQYQRSRRLLASRLTRPLRTRQQPQRRARLRARA